MRGPYHVSCGNGSVALWCEGATLSIVLADVDLACACACVGNGQPSMYTWVRVCAAPITLDLRLFP